MNPGQSITSVFKQYFGFSGRARRSEYWWFALFQIIALIVLANIFGPLLFIYFVATIFPALAVLVRRLHDTGRSAWWLLLAIMPFGGIVILILVVTRGDRRENRYGPDPLRSPADVVVEGVGGARSSQDGVRFCTNCGSALASSANFCRACGTGV